MHSSHLLQSLAVWCLLITLGPAQVQTGKLLRSDGNTWTPSGNSYGNSCAIEGTTVVVGSYLDRTNGPAGGAAYVFDISQQPPLETQKLVPSSMSFAAQFGYRVALSGDWLAVSAKEDSPASVFVAGSIVMYKRPAPGGSFTQDHKIWASDARPEARFGESIAMWQDRLVVGAYDDSTFGSGAGAAYVFELQPGGLWVQRAKLTASDPEVWARFGRSVAIHEDTILVGASNKDLPGVGLDVGAVYVFDRDPSGTWHEVQKLTNSLPLPFQFAGMAVALEGDTAVIGSPSYDDPGIGVNSGAAFVFTKGPLGWIETQRLRTSDHGPSIRLGGQLVMQPGRMLVAAGDDDLLPHSGSVFIFEQSGGGWQQTGKALANDGNLQDNLGISIAASGDLLVAGALGTDDACPGDPNCNSGAAYVFRLPTDTRQHCFCKSPAGPCGNHDDFGGCRGSSGQGAVLSAAGSGSVALDDLELQGRWMPSGDFALLFMGASNHPSGPFADGRMCIGPGAGGFHRFPVSVTSGTGSVLLGPGLATYSQGFPPAGQIQPGQTWHFQLWFRDFFGPCGTGSNLSNALQVEFRP